MKVGYARVSTADQNLDRQLAALNEAQVEKIYAEKLSGKNAERPQLQEMMTFIRDRDEVVVASLDRLGRNSNDLTTLIEEIRKKGAVLNVLDLPSFAGVQDPNLKSLLTNLVLELYKYTAEQERTKIRERQRQGIEQAKKRGAYKGQPLLYAPESPDPRKARAYKGIVRELVVNAQAADSVQKRSISAIAREWGVTRTQVYRIRETAEKIGDLQPTVSQKEEK